MDTTRILVLAGGFLVGNLIGTWVKSRKVNK